MTLLSRAGWVLCALLFATLLSSILHVDHAGWLPDLLLAGFAVFACVSPHRAMLGLLALVPVAGFIATRMTGWNASLAWGEALTCAALIGFAVDAARRSARTPAAIAVPAVLFGALVLASLLAGLGVLSMKFGPAFTELLVSQFTREYFTDMRTFPALHAGILLLEGTLLAVHGVRLAAERPITVAAARALTTGGALSAALTVWFLLQGAWARPAFLSAVRELAGTGRWNVHYADHNAAGSYYAMAVLVGAALVWSERGAPRAAWAACTALIAIGLWLTSSRMGVLAVPAAVVAALLVSQLARGGRAALVRVAAIASAACVVLVLIAVMLPQRGIQKGVDLATGVRLGLIQTGLRMIRDHPVFGLGLGEFYQRTAEFSSPDLIAKFPVVATGENAHNNVLQIAAELGIAGGILFTWLVAAALVAAMRHAIVAHDRFLLLTAMGVGAFALSMLGGHPLLIPEPGYMFWAMAGIAAGLPPAMVRRTGEENGDRVRGAGKILLVAGLLMIVATVPWRMRALASDANLEHQGINLSPRFETAPDGTRYKWAPGWAALFVPTGAFKVDINVRSDSTAAQLEVRLDGRIANVLTVVPGTWFHLTMPARTERATSRFARLDLRLLDAGETVMWITKVQPVQ
jgi:O-antigen ligase